MSNHDKLEAIFARWIELPDNEKILAFCRAFGMFQSRADVKAFQFADVVAIFDSAIRAQEEAIAAKLLAKGGAS